MLVLCYLLWALTTGKLVGPRGYEGVPGPAGRDGKPGVPPERVTQLESDLAEERNEHRATCDLRRADLDRAERLEEEVLNLRALQE